MIAHVALKENPVRKKSAQAIQSQNKRVTEATVSKKGEIPKEKLTKKAYPTWANDHRLLKKGGRTYTIPAGTPFLRIQEKCTFGQGYAEVTFSRKEALKFYPYKELPPPGEKLKVVIPYECLNITPKKGSWKGDRS